MKNYVVRLWAPVSVRVSARSRAEAGRRAVRLMSESKEISARLEDDFEAVWLEQAPWKLDEEDFEGGVYLSQVKGKDAQVINAGRRR